MSLVSAPADLLEKGLRVEELGRGVDLEGVADDVRAHRVQHLAREEVDELGRHDRHRHFDQRLQVLLQVDHPLSEAHHRALDLRVRAARVHVPRTVQPCLVRLGEDRELPDEPEGLLQLVDALVLRVEAVVVQVQVNRLLRLDARLFRVGHDEVFDFLELAFALVLLRQFADDFWSGYPALPSRRSPCPGPAGCSACPRGP